MLTVTSPVVVTEPLILKMSNLYLHLNIRKLTLPVPSNVIVSPDEVNVPELKNCPANSILHQNGQYPNHTAAIVKSPSISNAAVASTSPEELLIVRL